MEKTRQYEINENTITVDTLGLCEALNSGRATAVQIGNLAGARIQVGRRVLWNLAKVRSYVDSISR